jgi:hypothetical protein
MMDARLAGVFFTVAGAASRADGGQEEQDLQDGGSESGRKCEAFVFAASPILSILFILSRS